MITYHLSQKQIKHIRDSGRSVDVAIPIDTDDDPDNWIDYAVERITTGVECRFVSAEPTSIWTYRTKGRPGGMVGVLGQIVNSVKQVPPAGIPQLVDVLVVRIAPLTEIRPASDKLRWPGKAFNRGVEIAGGDDEE